jgi:predicted phage terminase large subunit-like protein
MLQIDEQFSRYDILQELLRRKKATESLIEFTKFTKPDYQVNWHHELICNEIDNLLNREYELLIVSTPPRFGKSEIVSRRLPAYKLGKDPDSSIIACSYSADLSSRMNRDTQRIIDDPVYSLIFPETRLNSSNVRTTAQGTYLRNSDIFEIVGHKGVYRSCGVGGGITGMGFSGIGIIDDPTKNREDAESITIRDKTYEWYTDVFLTRREDNAPILLTATRWNEDDLIGRIIDKSEHDLGTDKCKIITLPALSEEEIPEYDLRTEPNKSLWVGKFPEPVLNKIKATVPVYTWLSLYQQRPSAAAGNLVKREHFKYCTLRGDLLDLGGDKRFILPHCTVFQTCDPAASTKTSADYFVLATWVQTPQNDLALIDLIRTRLETPDQVPLFKQQFQRWKPAFQAVESRGLGISLYQTLVREGLSIKKLDADTDKVTRFIPAATRIAAGAVYFLEGASWLNDYETELLGFPNAAHDDQVDVTSYAVQIVIESRNTKAEDYLGLYRTKS